jgi:hypothetical protein
MKIGKGRIEKYFGSVVTFSKKYFTFTLYLLTKPFIYEKFINTYFTGCEFFSL